MVSSLSSPAKSKAVSEERNINTHFISEELGKAEVTSQ